MNVDFQNNTVRPVGVISSTVEPEKLPPTQMFLVNITEVSVVHLPPPTPSHGRISPRMSTTQLGLHN